MTWRTQILKMTVISYLISSPQLLLNIGLYAGAGQNNWNSKYFTNILRILIQISLWEFISTVDRYIYLLDCIFVTLFQILLKSRHGRAATKKPLIPLSINIQKTLKQVIFSDKSSFSPFPTAGRVYVWMQRRQDYNPEYLLPTMTHECGSVMVWETILRNSLGPIVVLHGRINSEYYLNILGDHVHAMV